MHTFGKEKDIDKFTGGTVFVDHASGLVFPRMQVVLTAGDTLQESWIWNHTPKPGGRLAPIETFSGARISPKYLNSARVWGCPAYVPHLTLQDDKKLPKWDPCSKQGKFLGFLQDHALTAGLILNLQTGRVPCGV